MLLLSVVTAVGVGTSVAIVDEIADGSFGTSVVVCWLLFLLLLLVTVVAVGCCCCCCW